MVIKTRTVILTSDGSGDATGSVSANGKLLAVEVVHDGTATPTNLWDLTINTQLGSQLYTNTAVAVASNLYAAVTVAGSAGANGVFQAVAGGLGIVGANMGASKIATVILYLEQ